MRVFWFGAILATIVGAGCAPARDAGPTSSPSGSTRLSRTLAVMDRAEPPALIGVATGGTAGSSAARFFSAGLTFTDVQGIKHPHLVEALPQLNTDTWRIFPDGRMETTHKLKPALTWHDGTPLDAADFVFGQAVTMSPQQSLFAPSIAARALEEVVALDARTVLVRWPAPYIEPEDAVRALPRHLLQRAFEGSSPDGFANLSYWTTEFVGLGPYRLDQWVLGAFIEGVAFDGHALGRPKIDRVRLMWSGDANAVVANALAGSLDFVSEDAIRFEQGIELEKRWDQGKVLFWPDSIRYLQVQFKPEHVSPAAILDVRVRKALMHSLDRQAMIDGLLDGKSQIADTLLSPDLDFYPDVDRVVSKYPYDLRRADALLNEAGFVKGSDGFYRSQAGEPLTLPILGDDEKELTLLVDSWRKAGVAVVRQDLPASRTADVELRSTYPGLAVQFNNVDEATTLNKYVTSSIAVPPRWAGFNRGGWSNPEFDRLASAYYKTLDRTERNGILTQTVKLLTDEAVAFPMFYRLRALGHALALQPPFQRHAYGASLRVWEWDWR